MHGNTLSDSVYAERLQERFWDKASAPDENGCCNWTGARIWSGYGVFNLGKKTSVAHRVAMTLEIGRDLEDGEIVMHSCDNRACVNPAHLSIGTQADNLKDCRQKDRHCRGERSKASKLTDDKVREMRRAAAGGEHILSIANRFNISRRSASQAVSGELWKHVKEDA